MSEEELEITPENAPRFAEEVVEMAKEVDDVTLDYSVASLEIVDNIIGSFHDDGVSLDEIDMTLFCFGCYVGEVFVRNVGATWRAATQDEFENVFGVPLVLELGEDNLVNPIGKVLKRLENGGEDNLPYFYRAFTESA